ncbi:prepilin-type N-terminal cleavage/methylation domain-containing protein [Nitratifractor sp.]
MKKSKATPAFTMIELIFVIVVMGILAAFAIPRLAAMRGW